jgi:hypothetical protein
MSSRRWLSHFVRQTVASVETAEIAQSVDVDEASAVIALVVAETLTVAHPSVVHDHQCEVSDRYIIMHWLTPGQTAQEVPSIST